MRKIVSRSVLLMVRLFTNRLIFWGGVEPVLPFLYFGTNILMRETVCFCQQQSDLL